MTVRRFTSSKRWSSETFYVLQVMTDFLTEIFFSFECVGWVDDDLSPLIYTIIAFRYNQGEELDDFQIYKGTSSTQQVSYSF